MRHCISLANQLEWNICQSFPLDAHREQHKKKVHNKSFNGRINKKIKSNLYCSTGPDSIVSLHVILYISWCCGLFIGDIHSWCQIIMFYFGNFHQFCLKKNKPINTRSYARDKVLCFNLSRNENISHLGNYLS